MAGNSGRIGEEYAAKWMIKHGYRVIERNYHSRYGEIDIIAEDSQYIVFVEVKTREDGSMVSPAESVTKSKQKKIILTAQLFLQESPSGLQPRFDVAAVTTVRGDPLGLKYFDNAFGC